MYTVFLRPILKKLNKDFLSIIAERKVFLGNFLLYITTQFELFVKKRYKTLLFKAIYSMERQFSEKSKELFYK